MKNRIKELRVSKNISQQELANQLNVTRQAITRWENGTINPSTENLIALANFFNCTIDYIILKDNDTSAQKIPFWTINKENIFIISITIITLIIYFIQDKKYSLSMSLFSIILAIIFIFSSFVTAFINKPILKENIFKFIIFPIICLVLCITVGLINELL